MMEHVICVFVLLYGIGTVVRFADIAASGVGDLWACLFWPVALVKALSRAFVREWRS